MNLNSEIERISAIIQNVWGSLTCLGVFKLVYVHDSSALSQREEYSLYTDGPKY